MEKGLLGHMGPLGEEGVSPLGLGAKGGAHPPLRPAHPPPLGSLVPHGGGEEDGTPLAYIRRGSPPFFHTKTHIPLSPSPSRKWTPLVWSLYLDWSSPP